MKKYYKIFIIIFVFFFYAFSAQHAESLYGEEWWHVYFTSPGKKANISKKTESPESALLRNIKNANKSFYGAFFEINSKPIVSELINAYRRGIDVKLVLEKDNSGKRGITELTDAGIKDNNR